jgi:hypothetical protein
LCQSSPIRINHRIREYLLGCANWEDYLDVCTPKHESRLIHLVGKKFKCTYGNNKEHTMFVGMAIDALSTVVLGYEIGEKETRDLWLSLLDRLNCRGILCPTFMSYGTRIINEAVQVVFPYSSTVNNFTRAYYDKRLKNKVFHSVNNRDLLVEAINAYEANQNHNLENYLVIFKDKRMKNLVLSSEDKFFERLIDRINSRKCITRFEGLLEAFQKRFQKFHMIKYDPLPIINGWIGFWMLNPLPFGFSRLSLYLQQPCKTRFDHLNCGTIPIQCNLDLNSPEMRSFLIELAVRSLHVPVSHKFL